jgi:arsenate reductase-like glutaredoxin family protein
MAAQVDEQDKAKAVDLVINSNLSLRDAEKVTGISKSRIAELVRQAKRSGEIGTFRNNKDKIFEALQAKLINLADDDLLKTMLSKRGLTDVGILEDKIRVIRGQATEVVDVNVLHSLVNKLPDMQAQIEAYEAEFVGCEPTSNQILPPSDDSKRNE